MIISTSCFIACRLATSFWSVKLSLDPLCMMNARCPSLFISCEFMNLADLFTLSQSFAFIYSMENISGCCPFLSKNNNENLLPLWTVRYLPSQSEKISNCPVMGAVWKNVTIPVCLSPGLARTGSLMVSTFLTAGCLLF